MARDIYSQICLSGDLVAQSPLHVGGLGDDVDTDLPLACDGLGQLYVPGTSLAGALRELVERLFGQELVNELWGFQEGDKGHASFLFVEDAVIEGDDSIIVEIRDHVGIDREFGAAAEHIKFDRAILPRGTNLPLRLTVEVEDSNKRAQVLAVLGGLIQTLEAGELRLGAAKTRGLGHVVLKNGRLTEQVLNSRQGILAWLREKHGTVISREELQEAMRAYPVRKRPRLEIKISWRPVGPLMVKAGAEGVAVDILPLTSSCNSEVSLVLPGSSVKGSLRNRAEQIIRTLFNNIAPPWRKENGRRKFLDAVRVELVNELFGQAGDKTHQNVCGDWLPGQGALGVRDCFAEKRIGRRQWQAIESAENDKTLNEALEDGGLSTWSEAYHVAIDRWLGSAAESMLYTVLEPHAMDWEPLVLELNLDRLPFHVRVPALILLFLVIRDLAGGRVPLGYATHRGMGHVEIDRVEIFGKDLPEELHPLEEVTLEHGQLNHLPDAFRRELNRTWQQWLKDRGRGCA